MSADRRTLVIAAVAMVVLIAVGVVSSAIFTASACEEITPEPAQAGVVDGDVADVLASAFEDADEDTVDGMVESLESLAGGQALPSGLGADGHLVGAAEVGPAGDLTDLGDGIAATGERTTALPAPDGGAAAVELSDEAVVVGDGGSLYALALANELTGQVDGIVAIAPDLEGGECFDTAAVGVALPFHLDARDGQLLLFRIDDDGDHPEVELRDPDGSVWSAPIELGGGPPGVLAERLGGHLGDDVVVTARRSLPDDEAPALAAWERADGQARWGLTAAELDGLAPAGDEPLEVDVVDTTSEHALVALSREEQAPVLLVAVGLDDGRPVWTSDLEATGTPRAAGTLDGDAVLLAPRDVVDDADEERTFEVVRTDPADGSTRTLHSANGQQAAATVVGPRVVVAVDESVTRLDPDGQQHTVSLPLTVLDVHTVEDRVALLLRTGDEGAIAWAQL